MPAARPTLTRLADGPVAGLEKVRRESVSRLFDLFSSHFSAGASSEVILGHVPGRIEILGKHTDYAGGHSLVCAVGRGFLFVAGANPSGRIRMVQGPSEFPPLDFPLAADVMPPQGSWANYPMTIARRVAANFGGERPLRGVDIAFSSDLPVGSGMSGSSALMMMTFCAVSTINALHETPAFRRNVASGIDLAMYLACCENGQTFRALSGGKGVGTFGGSEDHTAILNCRAGTVSLFRYAPTAFKGEMEWPAEWALIVAFSGVRAEKTGEAMEKYNRASRRASLALERCNALLGTRYGTLGEMREDPERAIDSGLLSGIEKGGVKDLGLADRLRMFLREEEVHMPDAVRALLWRDLRGFGRALNASHAASRRYLWNIAPEVDFLQRSARALGASGATGFGAGFGGSIAAVLPADAADGFRDAWQRAYARRHPRAAEEASFFRTSPAAGILLWGPHGPERWVDALFSRQEK